MVRLGEEYYYLLHPRPAYIIGAGKVGEEVNLMAASWVTPVSEEPPRAAVAIGSQSFTARLITKYEEFTINVYPVDKIDIIYTVGVTSGRRIDKVKALNLRVAKGRSVNAPILDDAVGVIERKLWRSVECGEVDLFIGEVVEAYAKYEYFRGNSWDLKKISIPLHGWGRGFYAVGNFRLAKNLLRS